MIALGSLLDLVLPSFSASLQRITASHAPVAILLLFITVSDLHTLTNCVMGYKNTIRGR